nr:rho GTPase-activating protein gacZ-like; partial [Biomphalaria glabrata]
MVLAGVRAQAITSDSSQGVCTVKGRVFTQRNWYGFLVHKAFHRDYAKIQYQITYPVKECCANLLIYYDDQVKQLRSSMTCEERVAVLPADNNQVIPLRSSNDSTGCTLWNETGEAFYVCLGERIFRSSVPRTWFFSISRCDRSGPLNLNYVFNITGYYGECEDDPLAPSSGWNSYVGYLENNQESSSSEDVYKYLSISLGIVAGLGLILAAVFFGLWFVGMKNAAKTKGSSVTSSQATMTQDDIFYVNPSLSDREQAEYSQSGSENYYEVIPERRSYESINTGLANGGVHMRTLRSVHGSIGHGHPHTHHHPHAHMHHPHQGHLTQPKDMSNIRGVPYVFEDYPPPPYQPPRLLGLQKNNGLGYPPGHSNTLTLPANQRQRPALVHHAYHSSLVPTSAALGSGINNGVNSSGASTSNNGMSGIMSMNNGNNSGNLMSLNQNNNNNSLLFSNSGLNMNLQSSVPNSLATFGSSAGTGLSSQGGGMNLQPLVTHQLINLQPYSSANSSQTSSISGPLNTLAAASHSMAPSSGQSETSA